MESDAMRRLSFEVDGPVEVDLNADDGDGSGVGATQIRIDGGEWAPVPEDVFIHRVLTTAAWRVNSSA